MTFDRNFAYGAPVTRLAILSNSEGITIKSPDLYLRRIFEYDAIRKNKQLNINFASNNKFNRWFPRRNLIDEKKSAPLYALISLANSESHNFTAEVLFRQSANSWESDKASKKVFRWLKSQGIPVDGFQIKDGSGLSRNNKLTSRGLSALLVRMNKHRYADIYRASMAITGVRGTLYDFYRTTELDGRFSAKTGTLTGIRTMSGILNTPNGDIFVSILSNYAVNPNEKIHGILKQLSQVRKCDE